MFAYLASAISISLPLAAQETGNARGLIGESPYEIVSGWLDPFQEDGFAFGGNSAIWAETPDRILINQRGETVLPYPVPEDFLRFCRCDRYKCAQRG